MGGEGGMRAPERAFSLQTEQSLTCTFLKTASSGAKKFTLLRVFSLQERRPAPRFTHFSLQGILRFAPQVSLYRFFYCTGRETSHSLKR